MAQQVLATRDTLHAWLEQQQPGYGQYSQSLWDIGFRSTGEIASVSEAVLQEAGLTVPAAAHLHRLTSQGVKRPLAADAALGRACFWQAFLHPSLPAAPASAFSAVVVMSLLSWRIHRGAAIYCSRLSIKAQLALAGRYDLSARCPC